VNRVNSRRHSTKLAENKFSRSTSVLDVPGNTLGQRNAVGRLKRRSRTVIDWTDLGGVFGSIPTKSHLLLKFCYSNTYDEDI